MTDYSQSGEQAAILAALVDLGADFTGRFLDIGAGDGEKFSNTRALVERGWSGVAVEPAAWAFERLADLYRETPRVQLCQALITAERSGLMTFLYAKGDHVSTVEPSEAQRWAGRVEFQRLTAAAVTLDHLLDWFEGDFSFVSIDAEGRTNEIVRAYSRHPAWEAVKVICYERENWRHAGATHLAPPFELVVETPNNLICARR